MNTEPEITPDLDAVEALRMTSQQFRQPLQAWEAKALFTVFDEREKSRRTGVALGIMMAEVLMDREDTPGRVARLFLKLFSEEGAPYLDSTLDRILEEARQSEKNNSHGDV